MTKAIRLLGTCSALVSTALLSAAFAQTQTPASTSAAAPPAAMRPQQATLPKTPRDPSMLTASKASPLLGLSVFSLDGARLGNVRGVEAGADGVTSAIYLITGGFLGFGGKLVALPVGTFTHDPEKIVVHMSVDEVGRLPAVEEQG
jgi:hypothetical protein